jgi:oxygen-dependent protoporphyrinogen oxidase
MSRVVVVGGGMAGLATAYELTKRGADFELLEAGPRAGGVVLSEDVDGFTIDAGPDALLAQKREGVSLCEELGLGPRLISTKLPRLAFIQRGGKLHALPASSVLGIPTEFAPFVTTPLFSLAAKMRMAAELFVPRKQDDEDESIGAFIRRRFGDEAVTYLAEPLLAGIHAGDVERLSVRALFPRFVEAERAHGSLLRAFRTQKRPPSPDGAFRSLPGGMSELVRALVAALPANAIRLRTPVARVTADGGDFTVETVAGERIATRALVLAAPAFATAKIVQPLDAELARTCGEISYASTATVALAFPRSAVQHPLNGSGFVVPRVEGTGIMAGSWLSSKWEHRAPEGHVLLRTFIGGGRDPRAFELSSAEMIERSLNALRPLLGIAGKPELARVYRWERASAQHEVGHLARMAAIERALARRPGLFITGSGFRGVGIPDCVADGRATASQVVQWLAQHHASPPSH